MEQGLRLYMRAIVLLFSNILSALRATGPAWIALTVFTSLAAYFIVGETASPTQGQDASPGIVLPPYFWTYFMVSQCLNFMTLGYIGPKFHQAILSGNASKLPFPYATYLLGVMQIGLVGLGLAFLASRLISFVSVNIPGPLGNLTIPFLLLLGILYVLLRVSLVLPAISMGRQKTLREAWIATHPHRYAFLSSLVLLVLTVAALHTVALLWTGVTWLNLVLGAVASWFALMILLSYLNVIYKETRIFDARMTGAA